ncbi:MAG: MBL fold metallo-hydrolase [Oscillospiraceae bacterium]|nr:MBL fold metallo-hydrolase [Oscillospiraceae bacterium]
MSDTFVKLLGTRGSIPVSGAEYSIYGGATSCVFVRMCGEAIFLDAGSGLFAGKACLTPEDKRLSILISHPHIDHLLGLTMFAPRFGDVQTDIYGKVRSGLTIREQLSRLMSLPLWPVSPDSFGADTRYFEPGESFAIGGVEVTTLESNHPGGSTIYRLSNAEKSVVYCSDYEHTELHSDALAEFAADCNLLIYDAQFSDEEYESRKGWGHSTWNEGIRTAERCGAKRLVLFHHAPLRSDSELSQIEASAGSGTISFGKCGEEIAL